MFLLVVFRIGLRCNVLLVVYIIGFLRLMFLLIVFFYNWFLIYN